MKKLIILSTILLTIISCKTHEAPEFLRMENIQVVESNSEVVIISGDAFFYNPNRVGGQLQTEGLKIRINDIEMGTVSSQTFKVPSNKEFSMPLTANIPSKKLLNLNTLSGILNSVLNKGMQVQYKGGIKYTLFGFSHQYLLDDIQDIKIKL